MSFRLSPLLTDLYQLTMAAAYYHADIQKKATFSLFVRDSENRNFLVAAGLETVIDTLASFRFSEDDIAYLEDIQLFSKDFLEYLQNMTFTGDLFAIPEGSVFFADEPILEMTAPIIEAQILETILINTMGSQSLFASKGARCVHSARGRPLIDFSLRRTQGMDAGMSVSRSTFIAGFAGTSNLLAGKRYGIPVSGTMAHSYISAFEHELDAFRNYAALYPENSVFLIDTHDTIQGAKLAAKVGLEMKGQGLSLKGVRLDSGDMKTLSIDVRQILNTAGLEDVKIYASGGFDEYKIDALLSAGAQIDAFGVGTKIGTSADAPYLDMVYKLVQLDQKPVRKLSPGKVTLAGYKQVFRKYDAQGNMMEDIIGLRNETIEGAVPQLVPVMHKGEVMHSHPSLEKIRSYFKSSFDTLPASYKSIREQKKYPVGLSDELLSIQN